MKNTKENRPQALKPCEKCGKSLLGKSSDKLTTSDFYNKATLKRILQHLSNEKSKINRRSQKKRCLEDKSERRVEQQVKLRCRQLPNVVKELRKAAMKQDWNYVVTLTMILCHPGLKCYISIILRVCFILLLGHPKSNFSLLQNFTRHVTGYVLEEDVNKFIRILFVLKKKLLRETGRGKYIRKTSDYKVTRDPDFENL